jgi:hypothetical protein
MKDKEYKASYLEAVKDRALGLIGKGVHAAPNRGVGAAIQNRAKQIDDIERKAVRGYKDGGYVSRGKASKLVKNHKC